jgi:thiol-disulfide isomerase/thioredoxin
MIRKTLPLLLALTLSSVFAPGCGKNAAYPPTLPHSLLDKPLPELKRWSTLDGAAVDPQSLAGRAVVVKFFASYCDPCKRTLPATERAYEAHANVVFLGISEDESSDTAKAMVSQYGLTFPVIKDRGQALFGRFRVDGLPATFVVDRAGLIRWVGGGAQSEEDLLAAIDAADR